jgi:hypothetical protein
MQAVCPRWLLGATALAAAAAVLSIWAGTARADALLYRCGPNVCRSAPDGTGQRKITSDGKPIGPTYGWISASADGSRLAVVRATFAYVLDGNGRQIGQALPRGGTAVIAEIAPDGSQVATVELLPEITPAPVGSPPGSPGMAGFQPYLFVMGADGAGRDATARAVVDIGWLGGRLVRTDSSSTSPFSLGLCLLAANTDFPCERDVARDPTHDLVNPAFSPDGKLVAVVQSQSADIGTGPIVVYDAATAAPLRALTSGQDTQPAWSPDGRSIAFSRGGDVYVTSATATPGHERRVLKGAQQPVWISAPACRVQRHPRVRVRGRSAIVAACAPQPGSVTVTLTSGGRRVARRTVAAATGGTVTVRLRRPAGANAGGLKAQITFRKRP